MTEPILKLDLKPEEPKPPKGGGVLRWTLLGIALAALFAGVVMAMLVALPRPHTKADRLARGHNTVADTQQNAILLDARQPVRDRAGRRFDSECVPATGVWFSDSERITGPAWS